MIKYYCHDYPGPDELEVQVTSIEQLASETMTLAMRIHGQIAARDPKAAEEYIHLLRITLLTGSPVLTAPARGTGTTIILKRPTKE